MVFVTVAAGLFVTYCWWLPQNYQMVGLVQQNIKRVHHDIGLCKPLVMLSLKVTKMVVLFQLIRMLKVLRAVPYDVPQIGISNGVD